MRSQFIPSVIYGRRERDDPSGSGIYPIKSRSNKAHPAAALAAAGALNSGHLDAALAAGLGLGLVEQAEPATAAFRVRAGLVALR